MVNNHAAEMPMKLLNVSRMLVLVTFYMNGCTPRQECCIYNYSGSPITVIGTHKTVDIGEGEHKVAYSAPFDETYSEIGFVITIGKNDMFYPTVVGHVEDLGPNFRYESVGINERVNFALDNQHKLFLLTPDDKSIKGNIHNQPARYPLVGKAYLR